MDIVKLRYFCTLVQTGSFSKASELLHISQPALSKSMKALETEVGFKLILPSGRGIVITDYGKKLALEATPLIEKVNSLKNLNIQKEGKKVLSIATFEVFSTYFLGGVVSQNFSDYEVNILELIPGKIEEAIIKAEADIGITYLPIPKPEIDILKVATLTMGIYGLKKNFTGIPLSELPFVIPNIPISGTPSKVKGLDGWPDHTLPRKIKFQVSLLETALEFCRQGQCVGYFPDFLIQLHNEKVKTEYHLEKIKNPPGLKTQTQDVFLIKRKSDLESSHFKKISRAFRML